MRGEVVTVAMQGDFGKPRPALIIQSDLFDVHPSMTVLPVSSSLVEAPLFRVTVQPTKENGLCKPSQVMVDKAMSVKRERIGSTIGRIDANTMVEVERRLAMFLGIAK